MQNYEDVNKEIQEFLSSKKIQPVPMQEYKEIGKSDNLQYILESLHQTYNEINSNLKYGNETGVKDAMLRNDIKINMVNESLLDTLRKCVTEKNKLLEENQQINREKCEIEQNLNKNKFYAQKLEDDVKYKVSSVNELNRIIQDQKQKLSEMHMETEKAKSSVTAYKSKIDEMETMRRRVTERFSTYDKEMETLNKLASEREEALKKIIEEKRTEEKKNSNVKIKLNEYERQIESLSRRLEIKEKNLLMCNTEMSKLITDNKKYSIDNEKYKNNSVYYEKLNKNLSEQNAYLNKQLNQIIQSEKYAKDGVDVIDMFNKKRKKYKSKSKKLKKEISEIKEKNEELQEQIKELKENELYRIDPRDDTIKLHDKIDELAKLNKEYKNKVDKLEKESKSVKIEENKPSKEYKHNDLGRKDITDKISFLKQTLNSPIKHKSNTPINDKLNKIRLNENKYSEGLSYRYFKNNKEENRNSFINRDNVDITPKYKPIELENNYDVEIKPKNIFMGGFEEHRRNNFDELRREENKTKYTESDRNKMTEKLSKLNSLAEKVDNKSVKHSHAKDIFDAGSTESVKSFQTSSTLKEMMERTDKLQKRFQNLEDELNHINDNKTEDKLKKQMKMYNGFYKDINVDSESDIL